MKLHCVKGDYKAAKVIAILNATEQQCQINYLDSLTYLEDQDFLLISPLGKTPVLQTGAEILREANSIMRFVARRHKDRGYAGVMPKEEAQIDEWLEYVSNTLDPLVLDLRRNLNDMNAQERLREQLTYIESNIKGRSYLVGYGPTLADLDVATSLICPFFSAYEQLFSKEFIYLTLWLKDIKTRLRLGSLPLEFLHLEDASNFIDKRVLTPGRTREVKIEDQKDSIEAENLFRDAPEANKNQEIDANDKLPETSSDNYIKLQKEKSERKGEREQKDKKNDSEKNKKGIKMKHKKSSKDRKNKKDTKEKKKLKSSSSSSSSSRSSSNSSVSIKRSMKKLRKEKKKLKRQIIKINKLIKKIRSLSLSSSSSSSSSSSRSSSSSSISSSSDSSKDKKKNKKGGKRKKKDTKEKKGKKNNRGEKDRKEKKDRRSKKEKAEYDETTKKDKKIKKDKKRNKSLSEDDDRKIPSQCETPKDHHTLHTVEEVEDILKTPSKEHHSSPIGPISPVPYSKSPKSIESKRSEEEEEVIHIVSSFMLKVLTSQSYKKVDMALLNLRASLSGAATPEKKMSVIDEFERVNATKGFYTIKITERGKTTDIREVDKNLRSLLPGMIFVLAAERGEKKFIAGGLYYGDKENAFTLNQQLFNIQRLTIRDEQTQVEFLNAMTNVMRTKEVEI